MIKLKVYVILYLILTSLFSCNIVKKNKKDSIIKKLFVPEMVFVQSGTFFMGEDFNGDNYNNSPKHKVTLDSFKIGKYEITNKEYCSFLNSEGNQFDTTGEKWCYMPADIKKSFNITYKNIYENEGNYYVKKSFENYPVVFVSWYGAEAYCKWLSENTDRKFRLPTEAEWEYAAKSEGENYLYSWGNSEHQDSIACNYGDLSYYRRYGKKINYYPRTNHNDGYEKLAPVGVFSANKLGIYDMTGNVSEWCLDWYSVKFYSTYPINNPCCMDSGIGGTEAGKVIRDGNYSRPLINCATTIRGLKGAFLNGRGAILGFRIVEEL